RNLSAADAPAKLDEARKKVGELEQLEAQIGSADTDIREALRLARSVLPEDSRRRIVLLTDGNWTRGDPEGGRWFLAKANIHQDVEVGKKKEVKEVVAERLVAPAQAKIREPVELELVASSSVDAEVTMKLYRDQFLLKSDKVALKKGRN